MAIWETKSIVKNGAVWVNGAFDSKTTGQIVKIDDGNGDSDTVFTAGETVTLTTENGSVFRNYIFQGILTVGGEEYPVVSTSGGFIWYAAGLPLDTEGIPTTLSASDLDRSDFTVCFFPDTQIATPSGERKVGELVPGDLILNGESGIVPATWFSRKGRNFHERLGFEHAVAVKWIGRQTVSTLFGPAERLMPVRFAAGSLGGGQPLLPHRDLTVTADHAMLVDGVLCEAGALVNETTITRIPLSEFGDSYTVFHIETESHEIILANGAPSETFVDNVSRRAFDNYAEFEKLHGDQPEMKELPYPRASNARHLPARIKSRLGIGAGKYSVASDVLTSVQRI